MRIEEKIHHLLHGIRVMTVAVTAGEMPWTAPVYFVFHGQCFYFFSNKRSRHIRYAPEGRIIAASIFNDSDQIDDIFGFQMSGTLRGDLDRSIQIAVIKQYVDKFHFLKKMFGQQIFENRQFFLEKFNSRLYFFEPKEVFLTGNNGKTGQRLEIDLGKHV